MENSNLMLRLNFYKTQTSLAIKYFKNKWSVCFDLWWYTIIKLLNRIVNKIDVGY